MKVKAVAHATLLTLGLAVSAFAGSEHQAKEQCKAQYKIAKSDAKKRSTHEEREAGEKAAKMAYKDCKKAIPK